MIQASPGARLADGKALPPTGGAGGGGGPLAAVLASGGGGFTAFAGRLKGMARHVGGPLHTDTARRDMGGAAPRAVERRTPKGGRRLYTISRRAAPASPPPLRRSRAGKGGGPAGGGVGAGEARRPPPRRIPRIIFFGEASSSRPLPGSCPVTLQPRRRRRRRWKGWSMRPGPRPTWTAPGSAETRGTTGCRRHAQARSRPVFLRRSPRARACAAGRDQPVLQGAPAGPAPSPGAPRGGPFPWPRSPTPGTPFCGPAFGRCSRPIPTGAGWRRG